MFRSLIRLALAFVTFALVIPDTLAHDSWISRGGHRNAAGEWCCGDGDCFVVPKERIMMTGEGYVIIQGPLAGVGPNNTKRFLSAKLSPRPTESSGAANVRTERAAASSRRRPQPERRPVHACCSGSKHPLCWRALPQHVTYRRCRH